MLKKKRKQKFIEFRLWENRPYVYLGGLLHGFMLGLLLVLLLFVFLDYFFEVLV